MTSKYKKKLSRAVWGGRKVKHYDVKYNSSGKPIVRTKEKFWPAGRVTLKENPKLLRKEIRDCLPIKPSKTCSFVGVTNLKCGHRPQSFTESHPYFYKFLNNSPKWKKIVCKYPERICVHGSWPTQVSEFQDMCNPISHNSTYDKLLDVLKIRGRNLKLPKCGAPSPKNVYTVETNQKANPGFISSICFGATHKRADKALRPLAESLWYETGKKVTCDTSLWSVGGRERFQKLSPGKDARSRFLLMPEGPQKIFGLTYASPFYKNIVAYNYDHVKDSEFLLGVNFLHNKFSDFSDRLDEYTCVMESDASRHDQRCTEEFMVMAFGMLRSCFPDSEEIDNHFLYFCSGFVFKFVVTPGRFIYQVRKGLPTGSPFTSIIVTCCQWLQMSAAIVDVTSPNKAASYDLMVYGDDNLIGMPDGGEFGSEKFSHSVIRTSGHVLDPCIVKCPRAPDEENRPSFLKTFSTGGLPSRPLEDTIRSISNVPGVRSLWDYSMRITGSLYICPFNIMGQSLIIDFRTFLRKEYHKVTNKRFLSVEESFTAKANRISVTASMRNSIREKAWFNEVGRPAIPWLVKTGESGIDSYTHLYTSNDLLNYMGLTEDTVKIVLDLVKKRKKELKIK